MIEYYSSVLVVTVLIGILALYLLPAIIAFHRGKRNKVAILLLNIFLGWSLIGWVGSLVWSVMVDAKS